MHTLFHAQLAQKILDGLYCSSPCLLRNRSVKEGGGGNKSCCSWFSKCDIAKTASFSEAMTRKHASKAPDWLLGRILELKLDPNPDQDQNTVRLGEKKD